MAVICSGCLVRKGLNIPAVRTANGPCQFCGDQGNPKLKFSNFTYPDRLLPGHPASEELLGENEGEGGGAATGIRPATKG